MALNQVGLERLNTATTKKIGTNKNLIINGAMNVAQRGTSSTGLGASAGYFTLDRYRTTFSSTAGRVTMEQVADVHDGFANALKFSCTTADTSVAANEYFILQQKIEGQDLQQLKKGSSDAEEFTVSFYVKGNASATYVVEMFDLDNTRQISKTFSVTTNWTRVELTFPGDTTGAFDDDNAASLQLGIWLHAGSTYAGGTLNSSAFAANTNANRAVGISSIFDSTARTFFITGLQLEVGSVATDFEHRSLAVEKGLCERYYQRGRYTSYCQVGTPGTYYFSRGNVPLFTPMRASITGTLNAASNVSNRYFAFKTWADQTNVTTAPASVSFSSRVANGGDGPHTDVVSVDISATISSGASNSPLPANGPGSNNVYPIEYYDVELDAEL